MNLQKLKDFATNIPDAQIVAIASSNAITELKVAAPASIRDFADRYAPAYLLMFEGRELWNIRSDSPAETWPEDKAIADYAKASATIPGVAGMAYLMDTDKLSETPSRSEEPSKTEEATASETPDDVVTAGSPQIMSAEDRSQFVKNRKYSQTKPSQEQPVDS